MKNRQIVIGTRGSELALWQSNHVRDSLLKKYPRLNIDLHIIKTLGDKVLDSPLSKIGDKGLFTKEIENALLRKEIDLAVHSLKDLPTKLPNGLRIGAISEREDPRDVFIPHSKKKYTTLNELPHSARIATGSLRRKAQLLHFRPDIQIVDIRGNLNTRIKKLDESDWDGIILAGAGVRRLGWDSRISQLIPYEIILPAVGQGALAIEVREDDESILDILKPLQDMPTTRAVLGERALLRHLEGGCQIPIGALGTVDSDSFTLTAVIGSLNGKKIIRGSISGKPQDSERLGAELAQKLLNQGGKEILEEIRSADSHS